MEIKVCDKDLKLIANNQKMVGGSHTALEIALARKCLDLQSALHKVNEQQRTYFDALTSIYCLVDKKAGENIRERRAKDLKNELKSDLKQSA